MLIFHRNIFLLNILAKHIYTILENVDSKLIYKNKYQHFFLYLLEFYLCAMGNALLIFLDLHNLSNLNIIQFYLKCKWNSF